MSHQAPIPKCTSSRFPGGGVSTLAFVFGAVKSMVRPLSCWGAGRRRPGKRGGLNCLRWDGRRHCLLRGLSSRRGGPLQGGQNVCQMAWLPALVAWFCTACGFEVERPSNPRLQLWPNVGRAPCADLIERNPSLQTNLRTDAYCYAPLSVITALLMSVLHRPRLCQQ